MGLKRASGPRIGDLRQKLWKMIVWKTRYYRMLEDSFDVREYDETYSPSKRHTLPVKNNKEEQQDPRCPARSCEEISE